MFINLSDVLTTAGRTLAGEYPLEMSEYVSGSGSFGILEKSPASLTFSNVGRDRARIEGHCRLVFRAACDRCLAEVPVALDLVFDRTAVLPGAADEGDSERAYSLTEDCQFDVEAFVYDEIIVNWPVKILCREDCKGVCPVCGQNRNERECGCDAFVPDPRMAVIQDIFNASKEV